MNYFRDKILAQILENTEKTMSGLTDLNAAVAALQAEVVTILADIATALQNSDSDAAVEQASQLVATATAQLAAGDPVTGTAATTPPVVTQSASTATGPSGPPNPTS